ncbi:MAG TPA: vWA domain-containing protein [Candidatus Paceibacterota bacterium]|nr:vWA domain-containing protein [Candidatus Paceibacterota bacterium]
MVSLRPWAFWRRFQYSVGFFAFLSLIFTGVYFLYFYVPGNCFDNLKNGDELDVDCGGECVRICAISVTPPQVQWAKSFRIVDGQYNAVAYVENKNLTAATANLVYTFKLLRDGEVIAERTGTTILPPNSIYPIFEGRIITKNNLEPTETIIEIEPEALWQPASLGRGQFRTLDIELLSTDTKPRLNVQLENTELTEARNVEVVATIFNREGEPLTASQTFIDVALPRSRQNLVFTWPNSIAKTIRSCEVPSDIMMVIDRSGSMAADGGDPPEPLSSAKEAAKSFVRLVDRNNYLGYFSYSTFPSNPLEQTLTQDFDQVEAAIDRTEMGKDGVQYTNMGDAIGTALFELISARHRDDARKVIIFLTDGDVTRPVNPETGAPDREYAAYYARQAAAAARSRDVTVYTIGFGEFFTDNPTEISRDVDLIRDLASDPSLYYTAPTIAELERVYQEIAVSLCEEGPTKIEVITKTKTNFIPLR